MNTTTVQLTLDIAVDIDTLPAGRELDALVAEKVMSWYNCEGYWEDKTTICAEVEAWNPSEDISAAWDVLEKLCQSDKFISLTRGSWKQESNNWTTWLIEVDGEKATERIEAPTAPLAICRAALKAVLRD